MAGPVSGPLGGVRVLDLTRLLPGNYATMILTDLGADVVKVEEPVRGDPSRWVPPLTGGEGALHLALNRGKRSVTVDLKAPGGPDVVRAMARSADALIESFRPGVMDRLGVGHATLAADHPGLVYCSLTGYGQDGPYRDRAGHDLNYAGYAGVLHATGWPGPGPGIPGVQVADIGGGMAAAIGMLAAVLEARATGRGRFVDVSLADTSFSMMAVALALFLATGQVDAPGAGPLTGGLACYGLYRCADGRFVSVAAVEPRFWRNLCEALDLLDLAPDHLAGPERQRDMAARLQEVFSTRPRDAWMARLGEAEACVGPVNDVAEAVGDPHLRRMVAEVAGRPVGPAAPIHMTGPSPSLDRPAPGLGEHTGEVLREAGVAPDEVERLRAAGVVGGVRVTGPS